MSRRDPPSTSRATAGPAKPPAVAYWDTVLDPQNLEREGAGETGAVRAPARALARAMPMADEIAFAEQAPDFAAARDWLAGAPAALANGTARDPGRAPGADWIIDIGAGLGANAFALARAFAPAHEAATGRSPRLIAAVDTSPARLRALAGRAREAGVGDRVWPVVAAAEALPFADGVLGGVYTKSVLIHTDMPRAAAEIARVLAPGGRAALVEPQPGNPLAAAYRRWLGPAAWRGITRYFDPEAQRVFVRALGGEGEIRPFYLLGFLAFAFQFAWARPSLWRASLLAFQALDGVLFRIPGARRLAWFGVILLAKPPRHPGGETTEF